MLPFLHQLKTDAANTDASFNAKLNRRPKHVLMLLLPFFVILAQVPFFAASGQIIFAVTISPVSICASADSSNVGILVIKNAVPFPVGNIFTAQLSDAAGSFTTPTTIGTTINTTGNIYFGMVAKIPGNLPPSALYKIRVIASNPSQTSPLASLTITNVPGPTLTLTTRDVSSCGGGSDGIITGTVANGTGPYTWQARDALLFPVTIDANGQASSLAPGVYFIGARDNSNGCVSGASDTIIQLPRPTIEVSTKANVSACGLADGFFTLRVDTIREDGLQTLKPWNFLMVPQDETFFGVSAVTKRAPVTFDELSQGFYKVTMYDSAGCSSDTINFIEIGRDTTLVLKLSGWGNPTTCGGTNGDITVLNTGGSGSTYRYRISSDGGANYGLLQSGRRFGGLGAGDYVIEGRDSRRCTDTLHKTLNNPKGCTLAIAGSTNELNITAKNSLGLQVFPNPAKTSFTLNLQGSSRENVQIIVTDMFGKKLYQTTGSSNRQYTFGQEFNAGVYIVQVIQGKQIQTLKLVKEN